MILRGSLGGPRGSDKDCAFDSVPGEPWHGCGHGNSSGPLLTCSLCPWVSWATSSTISPPSASLDLPGERNGNLLQHSCLGNLEPHVLQSMGSQRAGHDLATVQLFIERRNTNQVQGRLWCPWTAFPAACYKASSESPSVTFLYLPSSQLGRW